MKKIILLLLLTTSAWSYEYALQVKQKDGTITQIPLREIQSMIIHLNPTGVSADKIEEVQKAIQTFTLLQNYPNPFNPSTTITFLLPQNGLVKVTIYDVNGRQVRILSEKSYPAGSHELRWDGLTDSAQTAAAGAYFYKVRCGEQTITRKMLLIK